VKRQSDTLKRRISETGTDECAIKKLRASGKELQRLHAELEEAQAQASGTVPTPDIHQISDLLDHSIYQGTRNAISDEVLTGGAGPRINGRPVHSHVHHHPPSTLSPPQHLQTF